MQARHDSNIRDLFLNTKNKMIRNWDHVLWSDYLHPASL